MVGIKRISIGLTKKDTIVAYIKSVEIDRVSKQPMTAYKGLNCSEKLPDKRKAFILLRNC